MNDLRALAAKLNPVCHHALEIAVKQTARHRHFMVEIEHFLLALLDARHSDLALACAVQGLAANRFRDQLTQAIEGFERGNDRAPALARPLADLLFASWMVASQEMGLPAIRSGAILKALLDTDAIGVSPWPQGRLSPPCALVLRSLRCMLAIRLWWLSTKPTAS